MTTLRFLIILLLVLNALAFSALRGWLGNAPPAGEPGRLAAQLNPERIRLAGEGTPAQPTSPPASAAVTATPPLVAATELPSQPPAAEVADALEQPPAGETDSPQFPAADAEADAAAASETPTPDGAETAALAPATGEATRDGEAAPAEPAPAAAAPAAACQAWANLTADQADRLSQRLRRIGATPIRSRTETPESWWVRIPPQRSRADAERRVVELNLLGVTDTFIVQDPGPTQYAVSLGVFKTEARARVLLGQLRDRGVTNAGIEPRTTTTYRIQASIPARELRTVESAAPGLRGRRQACAPR